MGPERDSVTVTTPRGAFGPHAMVLAQVEAAGLVQTFGLLPPCQKVIFGDFLVGFKVFM